MNLTKQQRTKIYNKSKGKCWYCGTKLPKKGWHADHFLPVGRIMKYNRAKRKKVWTGKFRYPKRDTMSNLVPSCPTCNFWKKSKSINTFRKSLQKLHQTVMNNANVRMAEKYGIVTRDKIKIIFWFEKHQKRRMQ